MTDRLQNKIVTVFIASMLFQLAGIAVLSVRAEVFVYSLNSNQALIAVEVRKEAGKTTVSTHTLTPNISEAGNPGFLYEIAGGGHNSLQKVKSVSWDRECEKSISQPGRGGTFSRADSNYWQISWADRYTSIAAFKDRTLMSRHLLHPKAPFVDMTELLALSRDRLSSLGRRLFSKTRDGFILAGVENRPAGYILDLGNDNRAEILYTAGTVPQAMFLHVARAPKTKNMDFELRAIHNHMSDVRRRRVSFEPDEFIEKLEPPDQWSQPHIRTFVKNDHQFRLRSALNDSFDAIPFVRSAITQKLIDAKTIKSASGSDICELIIDDANERIYPKIQDGPTLRFSGHTKVISDAKQKISATRKNVEFDRPISWRIDDNRLIADIDYLYDVTQYGLLVADIKTEIENRFRNVFGKVPYSYRFKRDGNKISVTGKGKKRFFFRPTIGELELYASSIWKAVYNKQRQVSMNLSGAYTFRLDSENLNIIFRYPFIERTRDTHTVVIALGKAYLDTYGIRPDFFKLQKGPRHIGILAALSKDHVRSVSYLEVVEHFSDKFSPATDCITITWRVAHQDDGLSAEVRCETDYPIPDNMLHEQIQSNYDLLEDPRFELINDHEIRGSFWGFIKKKTTD